MPRRPSELSVRDWISLPIRGLQARGVDPNDRVHYTGHLVQLPRAYLPSIGNWGRLDLHEFLDLVEPHRGLLKIRHGAYRQFKHKHGLYSRNDYELRHGRLDTQPWIFGERCWVAVTTVQAGFRRTNTTDASLGIAARKAVYDCIRRHDSLGVLPVEAVLWTRVFDTFLSSHALAYDEWREFDDAQRDAFWSAGIDGKAWGLELIAGNAARQDLPYSASLLLATG